MLTSFFRKSKPVHFLILGAFISFGFIWRVFIESSDKMGTAEVLVYTLLLGVTVLGIILLDFIVSRNHLTQRNAYAILFYSCFLVMLPVIFLNSDVLLANFFLLLALRRVISLRKDTNSEKKILDTAIWTTVASLFYFWSLLFFIPLWIAIIQKPNLTYKQLLIPILGFLAVLIIVSAYSLLVNEGLNGFDIWNKSVDLDFSRYNSRHILIPATLVLTLMIFSLLYRWRSIASISLREKSNALVFFIIVFTSLTMAVLGGDKDGSEMIFLFAPTAILCANYIEGSEKAEYEKKDKVESWFKESLLWLVCFCAIIFLFS